MSDSSTMIAFDADEQAWMQRFGFLRDLVRQEPLARLFATTTGPPRSMLCLLEECARNNGHADLLREAVDGATGE